MHRRRGAATALPNRRLRHPAARADVAVDVTLLYIDGCPNSQQAETRVRQALRSWRRRGRAGPASGPDAGAAPQLTFRGSPTVLINGADPFADPAAPVGLACRVHRTPTGPAGAPSIDELTAALHDART